MGSGTSFWAISGIFKFFMSGNIGKIIYSVKLIEELRTAGKRSSMLNAES
jgi:hypothetical protein